MYIDDEVNTRIVKASAAFWHTTWKCLGSKWNQNGQKTESPQGCGTANPLIFIGQSTSPMMENVTSSQTLDDQVAGQDPGHTCPDESIHTILKLE